MKRKIVLTVLIFTLILSVTLVACDNKPKFLFDEFDASAGGSDETVLPTEIPETASEPSLQIHYYRTNSADYLTWGFWIWVTGGTGKLYSLNYQDENGGIALYPLSKIGSNAVSKGVEIIPRLKANWVKDVDKDRKIDFADYQMDENNYYHVYLVQGDGNLYKTLEEMQQKLSTVKYTVNAVFDSDNQIAVKTSAAITHLAVFENDRLLAETKVNSTNSVRINFGKKGANIERQYSVDVTFGGLDTPVHKAVDISPLYDTEVFDDAYYYDGELGAIYSPNGTTFRVWSPVSTSITLNIYNDGSAAEPPVSYDMTKGANGVFEAIVEGDLAAKYYTYSVCNFAYPNGAEIVDPYAKSAGLNGVPGQIVNFDDTDPDGWEEVSPKAYDRKELVVWETHVADVTSSATWTGIEANRKKFLGMIERGTTYTLDGKTVKTGFDHIAELGVNAVQLVPVFDQANSETNVKFNWGYNPLNYNVLEGAYSSDASDGYSRIREFKQLVQAFNGEGINIIMDVVYNHVNQAGGSNFDVLMPGYYFRYKSDGTASNGSGCGNETASERSMFRKFMIDSVCFWAKEYKLGGFRFDLMGVHDVETMNQLNAELKKINPAIVVYGEPWTGGTAALSSSQLANQANGNQLTVGQFNDQMRDALIKGGMNSASSKGWVTNTNSVNSSDVNKILVGLKGGVELGLNSILDPDKTVNYVTCHDNYTLYDRIVASGVKPSVSAQTIRNMAVLANSVVLTSNGTSFLLSGEEFLRTKGGNSNSYQSDYKVNELNYALKARNYEVFEIYRKLIEFKVSCGGLHLAQEQIDANYKAESVSGGAAIVIDVTASKNNRTYRIVHANGAATDVTVDFDGYTLYLDTLNTGAELTANTSVSAFQTIIAFK